MEVEIESYFKQYREQGCLEARNRLIEHYLPFIKLALSKCRAVPKNKERSDYLSSAVSAFIKTIDRVDLQKGNAIYPYISRAIHWEINHQVSQERATREYTQKKCRKYLRAFEELTSKLSREPTDLEIMRHLGIDEKELDILKTSKDLCEATSNAVNLDAPLNDSGEQTTSLKDLLPGYDRDDVIAQLNESMILDFIHDVLKVLSERERYVVTGYYLENKTFATIADELSCTHQACSNMNKKAVDKLRRECARRGITHEIFI